jgi:hypothetical protein
MDRKISKKSAFVTRHPSLITWLLLGVLLIFSLWLRLWQSQITPPGLHFDEAAYGLIGNAIREGDFRIFYREFTGREPIYMYAVALSQLFFGQTVFAERFPAALNGVALVLASFWCFLEIAKAKLRLAKKPISSISLSRFYWAWLVALAIAFCFWNLHLSREGYRANTPALFATLAFAGSWRAIRLQTVKWAAIAGGLGGLSLYTYLSARFIPFVFAGFGLYFLFFYWLWWRKLPDFPKLNKVAFKLLAVWLGGFAVVVAPLAIYFLFNRGDFFQRTAQISIFSEGLGGAISKFTANLLDAFKMISIEGTRDMKYNLTLRPVFDGFNAMIFYVGLVLAIWRARIQPVYGFLLIWLFVMFMPTLLSETGNNPLRSFGAMPAVMGIWAVGVLGIWQGLIILFKQPGWFVGAGVAIVAVALIFSFAFNDYFNVWAKSDELYTAFETDYTELAAYLKDKPADRSTLIASELLNYPTIIYLAPNTLNYAWANVGQAIIVPEKATDFSIVVPTRARAYAELNENWYKPLGVSPKVEKIVSPQGRQLGEKYSFKLATDFSENLAMTRLTCKANFNDEITLIGYRLNSEPKVGQNLALTLFWQAQKPAKANYQIFVHLLDNADSDRKWGQQDANGAYSPGWQNGDIIIGQYNLPVSTEAKAGGEYLLSVGLYDIDDRRQSRAPFKGDCPTNTAKNAVLIPGINTKS